MIVNSSKSQSSGKSSKGVTVKSVIVKSNSPSSGKSSKGGTGKSNSPSSGNSSKGRHASLPKALSAFSNGWVPKY